MTVLLRSRTIAAAGFGADVIASARAYTGRSGEPDDNQFGHEPPDRLHELWMAAATTRAHR
jgi:hypothetical protein